MNHSLIDFSITTSIPFYILLVISPIARKHFILSIFCSYSITSYMGSAICFQLFVCAFICQFFHSFILNVIHWMFPLYNFDVMQYIDERQRTNIPYKNGYKNDQAKKFILKKVIQQKGEQCNISINFD